MPTACGSCRRRAWSAAREPAAPQGQGIISGRLMPVLRIVSMLRSRAAARSATVMQMVCGRLLPVGISRRQTRRLSALALAIYLAGRLAWRQLQVHGLSAVLDPVSPAAVARDPRPAQLPVRPLQVHARRATHAVTRQPDRRRHQLVRFHFEWN